MKTLEQLKIEEKIKDYQNPRVDKMEYVHDIHFNTHTSNPAWASMHPKKFCFDYRVQVSLRKF